MPVYAYKCKDCGKEHEVIAKIADAPPTCPVCTGVTTKLLSTPGFICKGGGWHGIGYKPPKKIPVAA